jgi:hypothetical protein
MVTWYLVLFYYGAGGMVAIPQVSEADCLAQQEFISSKLQSGFLAPDPHAMCVRGVK